MQKTFFRPTLKVWLLVSQLLLVSLLVSVLLAACGGEQATPTSLPAATSVPVPTATPTVPPSPTPTPVPNLALGPVNVIRQNTGQTSDMGSDGYSWSQAFPITVDKYNKIIALAQKEQAGHKFLFSNDGGQSWADNAEKFDFMNRATVAYDSINDKLDLLYLIANPATIGYWRFDITRDSANNITAITRDKNINLKLDAQTSDKASFEHPIMLWLDGKEFGPNGALVALWSARNSASTPAANEIRASMRVLSNTDADGQATNWKPIQTASTSTTGVQPAVAYTSILANNTADIPYVSAMYKTKGAHAKDLYFFYADGPSAWGWRRAVWNSSSADWNNPLTAPVTISPMVRAGKDTGYNLKHQLGTKPVEDTINDRVYYGFATWKDDKNGDTWNFVYVDKNDNLSPITDVYSSGGPHSFAPTGDITIDNQTGLLVTSYLKTAGGGTFLQAFNGTNPVGSETALFKTGEADIPLLWQGGRYGPAGSPKLLAMFRDTERPYHGYFATIELGVK